MGDPGRDRHGLDRCRRSPIKRGQAPGSTPRWAQKVMDGKGLGFGRQVIGAPDAPECVSPGHGAARKCLIAMGHRLLISPRETTPADREQAAAVRQPLVGRAEVVRCQQPRRMLSKRISLRFRAFRPAKDPPGRKAGLLVAIRLWHPCWPQRLIPGRNHPGQP